MRPLKVLHLIPTLSSGGAERQLANVVGGTRRELINHVVCVIGEPYFFSQDIRDAGFKVIEMDVSGKRPFLKAAQKFRKIIAEEKPDVIHSWLYDANVSARLASLLNGKTPLVTSLQLADYEPEVARIGNYNPHKVSALKAIDKFTAFLAAPFFVPCSEFVKNSYRRRYGLDESKTEVIYNAVNIDALPATKADLKKIRAKLELPADAFVYLNVGRLDPQKNHKVLFEAFQAVSAEIPNAFLLLAGIGHLENELKNLAESLEINEKVFFLGRRNDVGALLELADVFAFPSFFEGLPVALIEAMLKRLPCVASRIEVFEEVIDDGETGLLINPTSAVELKDAMIKLYKDEKLRESLGENAFREAKAKYDIAVTARQWEKFYQKVKATA
ncbi:MAG TPA: glycosyltransferase [Pyrinomonadaceae bacterium]|jgi:glycosyltransferase involved in cell wall biosynthesis